MKKSYTETDKQQWIQRYLNGETARSIAKDYPCTSESTVARVIKSTGISRGKGNIPKKEQLKNKILKEYTENKLVTLTDLGKKYQLDPRTIKKWLAEENISVKQKNGYISNCKEDYFEEINSPHKAYLLGFITAGGAVVAKPNGTSKTCSIEVHEKDKDLIYFAQKEINPKASITPCFYDNKTNYKINFSSTKLCNDLEKYGIIQNKSKTIAQVPVDLIPDEYLPYYFRGLIDGDGSISKSGGISIYSGSLEFIQSIQKILCEKSGVKKLKVYQGTTYFISWNSKEDKILLFNYLYSDLNTTYYYPRKYERLFNYLYGNTEVTNQITKG